MQPDGCYSLVVSGLLTPREPETFIPLSAEDKDYEVQNMTTLVRNTAVSGAGA